VRIAVVATRTNRSRLTFSGSVSLTCCRNSGWRIVSTTCCVRSSSDVPGLCGGHQWTSFLFGGGREPFADGAAALHAGGGAAAAVDAERGEPCGPVHRGPHDRDRPLLVVLSRRAARWRAGGVVTRRIASGGESTPRDASGSSSISGGFTLSRPSSARTSSARCGAEPRPPSRCRRGREDDADSSSARSTPRLLVGRATRMKIVGRTGRGRPCGRRSSRGAGRSRRAADAHVRYGSPSRVRSATGNGRLCVELRVVACADDAGGDDLRSLGGLRGQGGTLIAQVMSLGQVMRPDATSHGCYRVYKICPNVRDLAPKRAP
jgi:hypothetical protein